MKKWHFVFIVLISLLMMSRQFLLEDHFDRFGGDLNGHLHRVWWVDHMLEGGEFELWNHFENLGEPLPFLYPFTAYLAYIPALLVMGVKEAFKFTNLIAYIFGGFVCYKLAEEVGFSEKGALFSSLLYIAHPWTSMQNVFHASPATILSFVLLPLTLLLYRKRDWRFALAFALNLWVHVYNSAFLAAALPFFRRPEKRDLVLFGLALLLFLPYLFTMSVEINTGEETFFKGHIFSSSRTGTYSRSLSDLFSPISYPEYRSVFMENCPFSKGLCRMLGLPLAKFISLEVTSGHFYQGAVLIALSLLGLFSKKKIVSKMAKGVILFYIFLFFGADLIDASAGVFTLIFKAFQIDRTFHAIRLFVALSSAGVLSSIKDRRLVAGLFLITLLDLAPVALSFGFLNFTHVPFCNQSFESSLWIQENNEFGYCNPLKCSSLEVEKDFNLRPIEIPRLWNLAFEEKDLGELGSLGMRFWMVRKDLPHPETEGYPTVFETSDVLAVELDYAGRAHGDRCDVKLSLIPGGVGVETRGEEICSVKVNQWWRSGWVGRLDGRPLELSPLTDGTFSFQAPPGDHTAVLTYDFNYLRKARELQQKGI